MRQRTRGSPDRRPSPNRRSRMSQMSPPSYYSTPNGRVHADESDGPTPICRCRVLYLGSAVPHVTKDGLQGIQEPLKELYPEDGALGAKGIDSWLSVWSNGFLLENVDENRKKVTRFFPIESLHYCAAVRYVLVPGSTSSEKVQRFLPLDSPFARNPNINHPPLFAAILRRTTGIKVLECHVFICKRETAANALVRCAFHAYADSTYAKHLESGQSLYGTIGAPTPVPPMSTPTPGAVINLGPETPREYQQSVIEVSEDSINSIEKVEEWKVLANGNNSSAITTNNKHVASSTPSPRENGTNGSNLDDSSVTNGDDNHKVWPGKVSHDPNPGAQEALYDYGSTLRSFRSSASGLSHRNRPRQMMMPSSPPPPPIPEELQSTKEERKEKKKKSRSKSRDKIDGYMNGEVPKGGRMGSRKQSLNSLSMNMQNPPIPPPHFRMNGNGPPRGMPPPPHMAPPMLMHGTMPNNMKKSGTFSARGKGNRGMPPPFMMLPPHPGMGPHSPGGPPPHLMPPPGHPLYGMPPPGMAPNGTMEEPIYMPHNARPISPIASYQPGHFPYEAYYNQQQYATIDKSSKFRKNKKKSKNGGSKHQSSDSNVDNDSDFTAGIYKKGHINERAFSYSIRNEHRSRSYGSLSNVQFGPNGEPIPPVPNGDVRPENGGPEGDKNLSHMMGDLDLGEDIIERSEVPPGLYHPDNIRPPPHPMYGPPYGQQNHMMMVGDQMMPPNYNGGRRKR